MIRCSSWYSLHQYRFAWQLPSAIRGSSPRHCVQIALARFSVPAKNIICYYLIRTTGLFLQFDSWRTLLFNMQTLIQYPDLESHSICRTIFNMQTIFWFFLKIYGWFYHKKQSCLILIFSTKYVYFALVSKFWGTVPVKNIKKRWKFQAVLLFSIFDPTFNSNIYISLFV